MEDENEETHPSYGMIGISRMSGSPGAMFGSSLPTHGTFFSLKVKRAKRCHNLSRDWVYGREKVIEVFLTSAQFTELFTTMNIGDGVPCTIRYLEGEYVPEADHHETELTRVHEGVAKEQKKFGAALRERTREARELLLKKGTISVANRKKIAAMLDVVLMEVESNAPFRLKMFQEAMDKVSAAAKAELDSMVSFVVQQTGLKALRQNLLENTDEEQDHE